ncbi:hypothetical protein Tco_1282805 [Tanacetum coccineum]
MATMAENVIAAGSETRPLMLEKGFLADSLEETNECEDLQLQATVNFKADHIDAYDSDCDDEATENAIFMTNLSLVSSLNDDTVEPRYDYDMLSKVPYYDTYHDPDMLNSNIKERGYIENIVSNNESYDELTDNSNVISYTDYMLTIRNDEDNYVPPPVQKKDMMLIQKIEDENVSLAFQVSSFVKEREHIKLEYKKLYDSIKQTRAKTKLQIASLQQKLNDQISKNNKLRAQLKGKFSESQLNQHGTSVNTKLSNPQTLGTKLYTVTPLPKSKIRELLEQDRALKPLYEHIGYASKFAARIQESLLYVSASCPFTQRGNKKWDPATSHRKNNKPYVDASRTKQTIETIIQKHALKPNTRKTDNTMLPSTRRVSSINASGSKPRSNTKNDRIPQPSSRGKKNKVEAHHRKFKSSANKSNHVSYVM